MSKGKFRQITLAEQVALAQWIKELGAMPSITAICKRFSCGDVYARRLLNGEDAPPPPTPERAWEKHEDETIVSGRAKGLTTAKISKLLADRSEQAVRSRIGRLRERGTMIGYICGPNAGLPSAGTKDAIGTMEDRAARSAAERGSHELLAALQRQGAASPAPRPSPTKALTFEEQLERVRKGARLATVVKIKPAIADMTLGGVGSSML